MTDLSEEEKLLVSEMMDQHLAPETIALLIQRRRALPSFQEKAAVWPNYRKIWGDILRHREIERRRAIETDPERPERRKGGSRW